MRLADTHSNYTHDDREIAGRFSVSPLLECWYLSLLIGPLFYSNSRYDHASKHAKQHFGPIVETSPSLSAAFSTPQASEPRSQYMLTKPSRSALQTPTDIQRYRYPRLNTGHFIMNFFIFLFALLVSLVAGAPAATSTASTVPSPIYSAIPTPSSTATSAVTKCPRSCLDDRSTCQLVCTVPSRNSRYTTPNKCLHT
jgi:hypothetical protein